MSLAFLSTQGAVEGVVAPLASSPMERVARAAGAQFVFRAGWNVAASYGSAQREREACAEAVGWVDLSHVGKLEVQGAPDQLAALGSELAGREAAAAGGGATPIGSGWWCPMAATRVLVLLPPGGGDELRETIAEALPRLAPSASLVDLTSALASLVIVGPRAREVIARFCALDLRPAVSQVGSFHPGSVARTPGGILHEGPDRFRLLFGSALGEYLWTVVADAAEQFGGRPVGDEVLMEIDRETDGTSAHA